MVREGFTPPQRDDMHTGEIVLLHLKVWATNLPATPFDLMKENKMVMNEPSCIQRKKSKDRLLRDVQ